MGYVIVGALGVIIGAVGMYILHQRIVIKLKQALNAANAKANELINRGV